MLMSTGSIAYERTRVLLTKHKDDVEKVAQLLLAKEVITRFVFLCGTPNAPFH